MRKTTSKISIATKIFVEHFGINPNKHADYDLLEHVIHEFSKLPYENLTKFIKKHGNYCKLDKLRKPDEVIKNYTELGTGGTCFSLTNTLADILFTLGFECRPAMADMRHGKNIHCILIVETNKGSFLVDPGYLIHKPIQIIKGKETAVNVKEQEFILKPSNDINCYDLITSSNNGQIWRYKLKDEIISSEEFTTHWINSFNDTGMNSLHLNILTDNYRFSVHNENLRIVGQNEKRNEKLKDNFSKKISTKFNINEQIIETAYKMWSDWHCQLIKNRQK